MSDQVDVVITRDSVAPTRQGFGTALLLSYTAAWVERVRSYSRLLDVASDFAVTSVEYLTAQAYFGQNPRPRSLKIGRASAPTQRYLVEVATARADHEYTIQVEGVGVTSTEVAWTSGPGDQTFTTTHAAESLTIAAHGHATGDGPYRVSNSGGALPTGLSANTDYWVIYVDANTIQLAASLADANAGTEVTFSSDGTGTHTLHTATNDVIMRGLMQELNEVVGKNFTAATTGSALSLDLNVTADAAGNWFSLQLGSVDDLKITQNHADGATAADLTAIALEDDDWYMLLTSANSNAIVTAAAAWIEATEPQKVYLVDVNDSESITTAAGNSDTLDDLATAEYERTFGAYHSEPEEFFAAAWAGKFLPYSPGEATPALKTLAGVDPDTFTSTQKSRLDARNASYYYTSGGVNITWPGESAAGAPVFLDYVRDIDYVRSEMTADVMAMLAGAAKVPYTQEGIALVANTVRGTLRRAAAAGIFEESSIVVTEPDIDDISAADREARILPDISWSATYTGAVHRVTPVNGVVSL